MLRTRHRVAFALSIAWLGCGGEAGAPTTGGIDASTDAADAGALRDAGADAPADAGPDAPGLCRAACEDAVSPDFRCEGLDPVEVREAILADCNTRCLEWSTMTTERCFECIRESIMPPVQDSCRFSTPMVALGVFPECALRACDVIVPCSAGGSCGEESACLLPCGFDGPWERRGLCTFPESGACECSSGAVVSNGCTAGAECLCPTCGEGPGLCVTPAQRRSACFDYEVSPLREATARFDCGE
jgi:hypothetical protein